ncbi:ATP-dependent RecD-like DNA helicase [Sulfitobacter pontiacus]|uniref:ATP-dependent RecD-like DNA helicase n=1 Tax=Sulfitobacter pontiacus TaxID=60137 RepID=A0AAX3ABL9_9RHOB|nr:ATP-dependent RecD-like DNA helicase [Sulfitobacter pontiacus]
MSFSGVKFCVRSRAAFAPIDGNGAGAVSMGEVRPAAKRGPGPIDAETGLFQLGGREGKRNQTQNGFVIGERLFEQSSKANIVRFLAEEPTFAGIGNVRASKLVDRFGDGLLTVIRDRDHAVFEVLPEGVATVLFENFGDAAAEAELAMYLDALGIDERLGKKVVGAWGQLGAGKLRKNPYLLISWVPWDKVDLIGRRIGIPSEDPQRLCAACEYVLYSRLTQGHTWTSLKEVKKHLSAFIGERNAAPAIEACLDNHGAVFNADGLQPLGAAIMERFVIRQALCGGSDQKDMFSNRAWSWSEFELQLREIEAEQGFSFTEMQLRAIRSALEGRFNVFAGYAGSGKTSVLRAICALAETRGLKVHLMALSGRAAKRMTEATGYRSCTIARFIRDHQGSELEPANLVLIDEASMVDLSDLYRILRICMNARICLVGDPAQLPPIGFGAPFADLVALPRVSKVVLDKVHRQDETTGIPAIAKNIRSGIPDVLEIYSGLTDGVQYLHADEVGVPEVIYGIGRAFAQAGCDRDDVQIIAPVKRGAGGVNNINRFMSGLKPRRKFMTGSDTVRVGDPIVYLRNDPQKDLRNGSLGRLISPELAEFDGSEVHVDESDVKNIDLAYCLTVHKSQGSQWDRVIVPLFNGGRSSFVERSLIYTAVTRAAKQVVIVGDYEAYVFAVRSVTAANKRQSGVKADG